MRLRHLVPRSLFGQVTLILLGGLLASQLASLWLHMDARAELMKHVHGDVPNVAWRFAVHLGLTLTAVVTVSLAAVRLVTRPFQHLADAADAFGRDIEAEPIPEVGPTETRRAAEAFNRMQQRLKRLIAERGRALAAVSHDLRTPLTRLRLRAELVSDEGLRGQIVADVEDMQAMLDATLDYLRELRESEPNRVIDMNALVRSLAADAELAERRIEVTGKANAPYMGRLMALKRALSNVLDNALKYGETVSVRIEDDEGQLLITVEDDGPGIPAQELGRVADAWYRVDSSRSRGTGGVGLGLAIVRDIVVMHGGDLTIANQTVKGLAVTLALPRGGVGPRSGRFSAGQP